MTSPLFFFSPPLTTGIPLEALRSADEGNARRRSPVTMIRRQQIQLRRAPAAPGEASPTAPDDEPAPASGVRDGAGAPLSAATLAVAWQLAARVGQLLGSGAPRGLAARGSSFEVQIQDPPAGSVTAPRCA